MLVKILKTIICIIEIITVYAALITVLLLICGIDDIVEKGYIFDWIIVILLQTILIVNIPTYRIKRYLFIK